MIPSEQMAAAPSAHIPAMRPSPLSEVAPPLVAVAEPAPTTAPARRGIAVAALAAVVCGVLGFLVAPVLLGPAAIVGGFAGEHVARGGTRKAGAVAVLVAVVGGLVAALLLR